MEAGTEQNDCYLLQLSWLPLEDKKRIKPHFKVDYLLLGGEIINSSFSLFLSFYFTSSLCAAYVKVNIDNARWLPILVKRLISLWPPNE